MGILTYLKTDQRLSIPLSGRGFWLTVIQACWTNAVEIAAAKQVFVINTNEIPICATHC
jgi:hypothetical protein